MDELDRGLGFDMTGDFCIEKGEIEIVAVNAIRVPSFHSNGGFKSFDTSKLPKPWYYGKTQPNLPHYK